MALQDKDRIFKNLYGFQDWRLAGAKARGAWDNTKALIDKGHDWIINEIKNSGLRGRGGAGFPTGLKWSFMPKSDPRPSYLVINADESEPGSCKDREIMRHDPHLLIEGALLASFAMRAHTCYIYVRGEFIRERERLRGGRRRGLRGQADRQEQHPRLGLRLLRPPRRRRLHLRRGDGAAGKPRGQEGPAAPEAAVPGQRRPLRRADHRQQRRSRSRWRRTSCAAARPGSPALGKPNNTGTKLFQISGHVEQPCVVEEEMGIPLRELLERHAGGVRGGWDNLLAVIPGGSSMPCLPATICQDLTLDFDTLSKLKSGMGTAAIIVMDKSTDIIAAIRRIAYFYKHESCGQCTPCREGCGWMWRVLQRMERGEAEKREIDLLFDVTKQVEGHTICALGDAAAWPVQGLIRHFRGEIEARIDRYQAAHKQAAE